jgi:DNA helicase-2/ATP-dependent DNA helicase PcrA
VNQKREAYQQAYFDALGQLNPDQRQAVDQIEGPVMVIAGPGTGKTHILAARIGRILLETDAMAHNILCLTFTDAGVHAMRERLLSFIGPEAHRVHIYTFHSFCNRIIQENMELFGRQDLEPISELERVEMIRSLLEGLEPTHPLRRGKADLYFYESHLADLFQRMKAEDWTPKQVQSRIDEYIESLPERSDFRYQLNRGSHQKGDLKRAKYEDELQRMKRLRAAVELFQPYQKLMRGRRRYDYDDMILWVLDAFQRFPLMLRTYQEQYLYFLIDEYQDTNGSQHAILQSLIDFWEEPNVFIVGDDDQSIYEFQGARLKNLLDFYHKYESQLKLVVLHENYRSVQPILDWSAHLIDRNERRIVNELRSRGVKKHLTAAHPDRSGHTIPQIIEYPNRVHELVDIGRQLQERQRQGDDLSKIAVIYPMHKQVSGLMQLLDKMGVPYSTRRKVNVLDVPMIRQVRMILEYLHAEQQEPYSGEPYLFKLLHAGFWGISIDDLARLSVYRSRFEWKDRPHWRSLLSDPSAIGTAEALRPEPLLRAGRLLSDWIAKQSDQSLPRLVEQIFNQSGLLRMVVEAREKTWLIQVLHSFLEFVRRESDRRPRIHLGDLLDTFRKMDDNRIAIGLQQMQVTEEGVQLVTAHSAKGLEFDTVYLIDCVKDFWEPKGRGSRYRFSFPDNLTFSGEEDALEARRRLFYVGITRAEARLFISYSRKNEKDKLLHRAGFIDELLEQKEAVVTEKEVKPDLMQEAQLLMLSESRDLHVQRMEKALLDELLDGFELSISAMNQYLRCPLSFYYEQVLQAPSLQSVAASYGTAVHFALQRLFDRMLKSKEKVFPGASELIAYFEEAMERQRAYFSPVSYQERLKMGHLYLRSYYEQQKKTWPTQVKTEMNIRNVEIEGVPVKGIIDRVDIGKFNRVKIVDYKTGRQQGNRMKKPKGKDTQGGIYWRQLVFYKLLLEHYRPQLYTVESAQISYLEPDHRNRFPQDSIRFVPEDVSRLKEMIQSTYQKIRDHEFYEGCGEERCSWCSFLQDYQKVASLSDHEVEALDE